jgi:hypothetical protein
MHREEIGLSLLSDDLPFSTSRKLLCSSEVLLFAARRAHPVYRAVSGGPAGHMVFEGEYGGESSWQCVEREGGSWFRCVIFLRLLVQVRVVYLTHFVTYARHT